MTTQAAVTEMVNAAFKFYGGKGEAGAVVIGRGGSREIMTNEKVNKYIHIEIMGKCGHGDLKRYVLPARERKSFDAPFAYRCKECDRLPSIPDYCSDDSPRRLLNEVMRKVPVEGLSIYCLAEQIARACVEAHKDGNL